MTFSYSEMGDGFLVELKYVKQKISTQTEPEVVEKVVEKVGENVTENQLRIIEAIKNDNSISAKKLSLKIGISRRKVEENLAKLKKHGLLKRIGSATGGRWEVLSN